MRPDRGGYSPIAQFSCLLVVQFIVQSGFAVSLSALPFIALNLGGNPELIVFILGSNVVAAVLAAPIIGLIGDRLGRRGTVAGVFLASSMAVFLHGATGSLTVLLLARFLVGIHAAGTGVIMATVSDLFGKESAKYMGYLGAATTTGWILAPIAMWYFSVADPVEISRVLVVSGLLGILATIGLWVALSVPTQSVASSREPVARASKMRVSVRANLLNMPVFVFTAGAIFFGHAGINSTMGPVFVTDFGVQNDELNLIVATANLLIIPIEVFLVGFIASRGLQRTTVTTQLVALTLLCLWVLVAPTKLGFFVVFVALSGASQLTLPLVLYLVSESSRPQQKAYLMSVASTIINVFKLTGPYVLALMFAISGLSGILMSLFCLLLLSTLATVGYFFVAGRNEN